MASCGPVVGREELVELEHAELAERRLLHLAHQRAEVQRPALRPRVSMRLLRRMCSREERGSASMPTRPSRPDT